MHHGTTITFLEWYLLIHMMSFPLLLEAINTSSTKHLFLPAHTVFGTTQILISPRHHLGVHSHFWWWESNNNSNNNNSNNNTNAVWITPCDNSVSGSWVQLILSPPHCFSSQGSESLLLSSAETRLYRVSFFKGTCQAQVVPILSLK